MQSLHPALVHFPIAFILLACCAELLRACCGRPAIETVRFIVWAGLLGLIAAYFSGPEEIEDINNLSLQSAFAAHQNTARFTLWVYPVAVLLIELHMRAQALGRHLAWPVWALRVILVASALLVGVTGLRGGELVHVFGVKTAVPIKTILP